MKHNEFCRTFLKVIVFTVLLQTYSSVMMAAEASSAHRNKIVGAYFEEWSIYGAGYNVADVEKSGGASVLTHLFYAFANVNDDGQCAIADSWADFQTPYLPSVSGQPYNGPLYGNFAALLQLKQLHPNLKVLISIGGASASNTANFSAAGMTAAGRTKLASSCIDMFVNGNVAQGFSTAGLFDGVDLDWEFPTQADTSNFTSLVTEFRTQLAALGAKNGTTYQLTIAAPAGSQNYSNMQLAAVAGQLDFLNLEAYDYHGTWETTTNHAAPLLESRFDPARGEGFSIDSTVNAYLAAGVPARKLVLGIPAYGRGWTGVTNVNHGLYQPSSNAAPSPIGDVLATNGTGDFRDSQGPDAGKLRSAP